MKNKEFMKLNNMNLKLLSNYIPVVARVHGAHHLELHEVQRLFNEIMLILANDSENTLHTLFMQLREVTDNYKVPNDVCETYETVYRLLQMIDASYHR
ncbi:MAG: iron-sulfur cluster repair di-iron protein, ric [Bacilli bacterium]|nr:iron-sulfur cluster repair di-iron protein, ric [Bacilli bacterium]